ncbi:WD40 repeat-like protein [Macrolepiota fuliginosa MF-IS2]|uniref:WD40 repeat-like protein n=1 Tax=Macrolepiota fuliginosa MF-IS2 TaxID=1400762 RepID=A0A9P5X900_9AGAR|nr:WD40 repeat-like protein [Macrolepiota fuliginosa MF-IS2]
MAKHPKKKQRLENSSGAPFKTKGTNATLERLLDEESKDDEERKLESLLFGVPYNSYSPTPGEEGKDGGRPMANLLDSDLFFIDDVHPLGHSESESHSDDDSQLSSSSHTTPKQPTPSKTGKSAWVDSSTIASAVNQISLLSGPSRLRKLRHYADEDTITEKDYETRLRAQFERINPEPTWAQRARERNREEREVGGVDVDVDEEGEDGGEEKANVKNLFTSTNGILKAAERRKKTLTVLPSGTLSIERLRDANLSTQNTGSGEVKLVAFHPSDKVPILCVGTADRRVRLYNIDGHTSPLLQTLHIPSLPLTSPTSALFHPSGSSLLLSGPRPYFFTHDLQTGLTTRHDRGLWGTTFSHSSSTLDVGIKRSRNARADPGAESVHMSSFSPTGELLAVAAGKGAQVHLVDWKSGAGQVVGSLKCAGGGSVSGLWWFDGSSTSTSPSLGDVGDVGSRRHLAVLTSDAEVYLWDVAEQRCVRRWKDEGGFRGAGRVLAGTQTGVGGGYMAVGSSSGLINVYNPSSYSLHPSELDRTPKPIKSIGNLTTAISSLKFNHDAQLLAIASREKKDSMRLIHLPSLTSFANWPTQSTPLGTVTAIDFSPKSEYVAIGNSRGRVLLYHLREYGAGV